MAVRRAYPIRIAQVGESLKNAIIMTLHLENGTTFLIPWALHTRRIELGSGPFSATDTRRGVRLEDTFDKIYNDLKRSYDLTLERRKTLSSQATGLMGFAAIIETLLIGSMAVWASDKGTQSVLNVSAYYFPLVVLGIISFSCYIVTAILSLLAFRDPKWYRAPIMPDTDCTESIRYFFQHPEHYNLEKFALQLNDATVFHQRTNNQKYSYLKLALLFLIIGILSTAAIGFILLVSAK